jgi:hypothetical protein
VGAELDGFVGAAHFAASGADIPPANGHPVSETEHSAQVGQAPDGGNDSGNVSQNDTDHTVPAGLLALDDLAPLNSDDHSISQSHSLSSSAEFADPFGDSLSLTTDSLYGNHEDSLSSLHASDSLDGAVDPGDDLSSPTSGVIGMPAVALDAGDSHSLEHPAVISDARGGGTGGGGGHTGSTTPSPYTTHSGTNVDIHLTFDSSVGKAPAGFVSTVEKVADFFCKLTAAFDADDHQYRCGVW